MSLWFSHLNLKFIQNKVKLQFFSSKIMKNISKSCKIDGVYDFSFLLKLWLMCRIRKTKSDTIWAHEKPFFLELVMLTAMIDINAIIKPHFHVKHVHCSFRTPCVVDCCPQFYTTCRGCTLLRQSTKRTLRWLRERRKKQKQNIKVKLMIESERWRENWLSCCSRKGYKPVPITETIHAPWSSLLSGLITIATDTPIATRKQEMKHNFIIPTNGNI